MLILSDLWNKAVYEWWYNFKIKCLHIYKFINIYKCFKAHIVLSNRWNFKYQLITISKDVQNVSHRPGHSDKTAISFE